MSKDLIISSMSLAEVREALAWAAAEGWNPGLHDAECFYSADPQGFFAGKVNGQLIAVGSAVIYSAGFAFCGLYIVSPEHRQQHYGIELTQARLNYVGQRTTGIDGVLDMTAKYAKIGYVTAHQNARYQYTGPREWLLHPQIMTLNQLDFNLISKYDQQYFPAPREGFLKAWLNQGESSALGFVQDGQLAGYGVVRRCGSGAKIGPLFAENPAIAHALFQALLSQVSVGPVYLDIPEPNQNALELIKEYKLEPVFATARMYRYGQPKLNLQNIYGITTFELG